MRLILPLFLAALGGGAGIAAGYYLREEPDPAEATAGDAPEEASVSDPATDPMGSRERPPLGETEYTRMNNQFIIPVLQDGEVDALVVLSLSIETVIGGRPVVFEREPKLRDAFLQVMFDHANAGGFSDNFTSGPRLSSLRQSLWEAARTILGADVIDVLVTDIARQDT